MPMLVIFYWSYVWRLWHCYMKRLDPGDRVEVWQKATIHIIECAYRQGL